MRKHYRIQMSFTYKNGMTGGMLDTKVNSKVAIDRQIKASREWLAGKGHTEVNTTVTEAV